MKFIYTLILLVITNFSSIAQTLPISSLPTPLSLSTTKDYSKIPNYIKFDDAEKNYY